MTTVTTLNAPAPAHTPEATLADDPAGHAMYRIANAGVQRWPYAHTLVQGVFPPDYYAKLRNHLPEPESFRPLNDKYPMRGTVELTAGEHHALDETRSAFWQDFLDRFTDRSFIRLVLESYDLILADRFADTAKPLIYLFRDAGGYGIGPHLDTPKKLITSLFYLPPDDTLADYGTSILTEDTKHPRPAESRPFELDYAGYRSVQTAPFVPNSMISFVVSRSSHHAVRPTPKGSVRESIQYFLTVPQEGW